MAKVGLFLCFHKLETKKTEIIYQSVKYINQSCFFIIIVVSFQKTFFTFVSHYFN